MELLMKNNTIKGLNMTINGVGYVDMLKELIYLRVTSCLILVVLLPDSFVNLSFIVLVSRRIQLRTPTNLLLTSLATSNCLICMTVIP